MLTSNKGIVAYLEQGIERAVLATQLVPVIVTVKVCIWLQSKCPFNKNYRAILRLASERSTTYSDTSISNRALPRPASTHRVSSPSDSADCALTNMAAALILLTVLAAFGQLTVAQLAADIPYCPDTYGVATHPHPEYCDKFYLCENGTLTLETCENGLLFDGKGAVHNHCNYNWAVNCDKRLNEIEPISSPGCLYQFGIYAKGPGCHTSYAKCAWGVPYETPCEPGLAYDEKTHSCNWPDLLLDSCDPEQVVGFRCPDKVTPDQLAYKFWPYPRFTIPGECGRLITCVNGYPRLITCGEGKVVDEYSLTCDDPENVPKCANYYPKKK